MLDEMFQRNASKFGILLEYKISCSFFRFSFRATLFFPVHSSSVWGALAQKRKNIVRVFSFGIRHLSIQKTLREESVRPGYSGKNKVARNEKKKLRGFSYSKNMANFEALLWVISSSINFLFQRSVASGG